jgi:hypothetical protein
MPILLQIENGSVPNPCFPGEELPKMSGQHLAWVVSRVISEVCERLKGDAPFDGRAEESAPRFEQRVP